MFSKRSQDQLNNTSRNHGTLGSRRGLLTRWCRKLGLISHDQICCGETRDLNFYILARLNAVGLCPMV